MFFDKTSKNSDQNASAQIDEKRRKGEFQVRTVVNDDCANAVARHRTEPTTQSHENNSTQTNLDSGFTPHKR